MSGLLRFSDGGAMTPPALASPSAPTFPNDAACAEVDPTLFDADTYAELDYNALDICAMCPVARECLDYAKKHQMSGVWGGTIVSMGRPAPRIVRCRQCGDWAKPYIDHQGRRRSRTRPAGKNTYCSRECADEATRRSGEAA